VVPLSFVRTVERTLSTTGPSQLRQSAHHHHGRLPVSFRYIVNRTPTHPHASLTPMQNGTLSRQWTSTTPWDPPYSWRPAAYIGNRDDARLIHYRRPFWSTTRHSNHPTSADGVGMRGPGAAYPLHQRRAVRDDDYHLAAWQPAADPEYMGSLFNASLPILVQGVLHPPSSCTPLTMRTP
jgi:hypothetical protein